MNLKINPSLQAKIPPLKKGVPEGRGIFDLYKSPLPPFFKGGFFFAIICFLFIIPATHAQDAQTQEPLTIKSDTFHYDNQTGVATYTGNILATQGERRLTGDKLEIYRDPKTGKMDRIKVQGNPANYEGLAQENKPPIKAKAEIITYDIPTKFLTLTGNAEVEQEGDIYRSWKIEYDAIKDTVHSPASENSQTTIILKDVGNAGI